MMKCTALAVIGASLLSSSFVNADASLRGKTLESQRHRELFFGSDFSWANLLFELQICNPATIDPQCWVTPQGPGISPPAGYGVIEAVAAGHCPCPHCGPHPPPPLKEYCAAVKSLSGSSSAAASTDGNGVSSEGGNGYTEENTDTQNLSTGDGNNQGGSWLFNPIAYVVLAGAVATVFGAILWKRRKSRAIDEADEAAPYSDALNPDGTEPMKANSVFGAMSSKIGLMIGGAAAAGAAGLAMAGAARKSRTFDDDSYPDEASVGASVGGSVSGGSLAGSVSRRVAALESGAEVSAAPYRPPASAPAFISLAPKSGMGLMTVREAPEGIEVEGPYRPSSMYTV